MRMNRKRERVFLTGVSGFLGRYLLGELLSQKIPVIALIRPLKNKSLRDRVNELVCFIENRWGAIDLNLLTIVEGDIHQKRLGLKQLNLHLLSRQSERVIHNAAVVKFQQDGKGEPFQSNVEGTRNVINTCLDLGFTEFHYVSTAYVCGQASEKLIPEQFHQSTSQFRNAYEQSKWLAEKEVLQIGDMIKKIYRPTIIIGDSKTGYTNKIDGFLRFLELGVRFAAWQDKVNSGHKTLNLHLPWTGNEPLQLVPVDWVASWISKQMYTKPSNSEIFHLSANNAITLGSIKQIAEPILKVYGVKLGADKVTETGLEKYFLDQLNEYLPYLGQAYNFCNLNRQRESENLSPWEIKESMIARIIHFANNHFWKQQKWDNRSESVASAERKKSEGIPISAKKIDWTKELIYSLEKEMPTIVSQSKIAKTLAISINILIAISDYPGIEYRYEFQKGLLVSKYRLSRSSEIGQSDTIRFELLGETFLQIIRRELKPSKAFFDKQIEICGDIEKGLKLAVILEKIFTESSRIQEFNRESNYATA